VTSLVELQKWLDQIEDLVGILKEKFSAKRIIWSDLPDMGRFTGLPQPLRWVVGLRRNYLRKGLLNWLASQDSLELLEFPNVFAKGNEDISNWIAIDGYHPGEKVYALWAECFVEHFNDDLRT